MGTGNHSSTLSGWLSDAFLSSGDNSWSYVKLDDCFDVDSTFGVTYLKAGWNSDVLYCNQAKNYVPTPPIGAILTGIQVDAYAYNDGFSVGDIVSFDCYINDGGAPVGSIRSANIDDDTYYHLTLGGETDLWDQTSFLTIADTQLSTFGLWFSCKADTGNSGVPNVGIDGVTVTVYYYIRSGLTVLGAGR